MLNKLDQLTIYVAADVDELTLLVEVFPKSENYKGQLAAMTRVLEQLRDLQEAS